MVVKLLDQLDAQPSLKNVKVVLTLNIDESFSLANYQRIKIVIIRNSSPKGFGSNHNKAFELCNTKWFVVLNPDLTIAEQEPFTKMINWSIKNNLNDALLAPRVINKLGFLEDSVRSNLSPLSLLARLLTRTIKKNFCTSINSNSFFWFAGMCLVFKSSAFKSIGGFDERYFLYCEDYDICARLFLRGFRLSYLANYSIIHNAQRDSHKSFFHFYLHFSSLLKVWTSKVFWMISFNRRLN
jgi:N-acetylglucosaminyl-diphospho-decaprenol L-rhamnosyltransferase